MRGCTPLALAASVALLVRGGRAIEEEPLQIAFVGAALATWAVQSFRRRLAYI
jgi:hypothetical protein